MIKSSRVLNQGYTNYCGLYSGWSLFETLSNTEIADGWQKVFDMAEGGSGGTIPAFLEKLKTEGLNGFKIKDYKTITVGEIKSYIDKGLPVIADFVEIFGVPYHTAVIEGYSDTEWYVKNSWGVEWGHGGYNWSGNVEIIRAYVAIPVKQESLPETPTGGYSGFVILAPLDYMMITQPYGKTAFAIANPSLYAEFGGIHPGLDLQCGIGTPVYSCENQCKVIFAGWGGGWGNLVKTQEGNRIIYYAHLNQIIVKTGDILGRNQQIGFSGMTGNGTGPHLHMGIFLTDLNGWVDPMGYPITNLVR